MTTLSIHPEPRVMPPRKHSMPATLTAKLTLLSIIVATAAGGVGLLDSHNRSVADETRRQERDIRTAQDLADARAAFKEAIHEAGATFSDGLRRVEGLVGIVNSSVSDLSRSVAGLHSDVINLANRVDNIERRRNP